MYTHNQITDLVGKLEENRDYVRKMEKTFTKDYLQKVLNVVKSQDDIQRVLEIFKNTEMVERIYITPLGVVRLMEEEYKEFHNKDLDALFYQVMVLCGYEKNELESYQKNVY